MPSGLHIGASIFFLVAALASYLLLRFVEKRHREDPVFMEEQRRREEEYLKRVEAENNELLAYEFADSGEYIDEASETVAPSAGTPEEEA